MVAPPDSNNPESTTQHDNDLTLNGVTSADDFHGVPDLNLKPNVDASTLAPDEGPPGVDIFVAESDEPDRSWLSRLRALKASWEKEHQRRRPHDAQLPIEKISNLDRHLDSLAALRDVCTSIDQRLARVEQANAQDDGAAIDEVLHDLCSQMSARLVRVEATVQRTEEVVADTMLRELCLSIEKQLTETRTALQRTEDAVTDKTLYELCRTIDARLERTEGALQRSEGVVTEGLQELSGRMTERFASVEDTVRLTPKSVAERMLPNLERQLMQARLSLERTEEAVTDKALHELCQTINARLERTEDRLHRSEGIVAEGLHELSARMAARFSEAEETIQRIERIVSTRAFEEMRLPQSSAPTDDRPIPAEQRAQPSNVQRTSRRIQLPWMAGLVMPVLVLVVTLAIAALIKTNRTVPPAEKVVPLASTNQAPKPTAPVTLPVTNQEIEVPPAAALMANTPRTTRENRVAPAPPRSTNREPAPATAGSPRFVGTLSITSVPSGASVLINGKPAGKTPLRLPRQRAGSLAVQIAHDGFERWSAAVLVPADQLTQVTANLRASAR